MTAAVDTLIPGLSEALQRMVTGERTRFWIPPELGYPLPLPRATLVFDVELLSIQHAAEGAAGTVRVQLNSPDAAYELIMPDGTPRQAKGPQTFANVMPGTYRIKPAPMPLFATGVVASPSDMTLAAGGTLDITVSFVPIVH
jgi:hypothetical protein